MLEADAAQENSPYPPQKCSGYQPNLLPQIQSVNDLEIVLLKLIKSLTVNQPRKVVTISRLSHKFHDSYKQPLRVVMRNLCPDLKLIELLQTVPGLQVQKVGNDWQIAVEDRAVQPSP
jgi:hypothetical protein